VCHKLQAPGLGVIYSPTRSLLYRLPEVDTTPQYWSQVGGAIEGEETDDPYDDYDWNRRKQNFCSTQEWQSCSSR